MRVGGYLETKLKSESRKQKKMSLNILLSHAHRRGGKKRRAYECKSCKERMGVGRPQAQR